MKKVVFLSLLASATLFASSGAKELYNQKCANCHGTNGDGNAAYPTLNKLSANDMMDKLRKHKNSDNAGNVMKFTASTLSNQQMKDLSEYVSHLKPSTDKKPKMDKTVTERGIVGD